MKSQVTESFRDNNGKKITTESDYLFLHELHGLHWFAPENGKVGPEGFIKVDSCVSWHLLYKGDSYEFVTSKGYRK